MSTLCILYAWLAISHVPFVLKSILIVMYACQCVCTVCNFVYFVLCWNAWWKLWMKWYGMTDEFVSEDCRLQLHIYEVAITFLMEHDGKFTCIWDVLILVQFVCAFLSCKDVGYAIHDMCRSVSQKCYICELQT